MGEKSRAPRQWHTPPRRFCDIASGEQQTIDAAAERFQFIGYVGCGAGAFASLAAAAVAWADPIARFVSAHL